MNKTLFSSPNPTLSFEVFPPKKDGEFESAFEVLDCLKRLHPDFISVTYGAGGSKSKKTLEIASYIQNTLSIPALAHLTCVGSTKEEILAICQQLTENKISNVLALRGDRPKDMSDEVFSAREFIHASDLMNFLKQNTTLHFAGACYPEKHFESFSLESDLKHLLKKQESGANFLITQLFFDNDYFYSFREKARKKGITIPICAGIMPITSIKQLGTTISLSGSSIPKSLADLIAKYGDNPLDMRKAGLDYAIRQIRDLKENNIDGIHLYTMNKAETATEIVNGIS